MEVDRSTPRSQGVNGLKIWMLGCTMMIIAALCEYGIILFMKFRSQYQPNCYLSMCGKETKTDVKENVEHDKIQYENMMLEKSLKFDETKKGLFKQEITKKSCQNKLQWTDKGLRRLDFISLIVFPIVFSTFIVLYWFSF